MADARDKRAAEIQDAIRQVLYRDWDPIGVCDEAAQDEYDHYIGAVYGILAGSRSAEALIDYLIQVMTERMGYDTPPRARLRLVAQKLLSLDVRL